MLVTQAVHQRGYVMSSNAKAATLLDSVQIAAPCPVEWSAMQGEGERKRFCGQCKLHVYNISDMSKGEAEEFLLGSEGKARTCIRLFRRADGTVLTDNCPVGLRKIRNAARRVWHIAAAIAAFLMSSSIAMAQRAEEVGDVINVNSPPTVRVNNMANEVKGQRVVTPRNSLGHWAAGGLAAPGPVVPPPSVTVQTDPTCGPQTKIKNPMIEALLPKIDLKVTGKMVNKADAWQRLHSQGTITAQLIVSPVVLVSSPRDERGSAQGKEMLMDAVKLALKCNDYMRAAASLNNVANYSYYERNTETALKEYQKALEYARLENPAMDSAVVESICANMRAIAKRSGLSLVDVSMPSTPVDEAAEESSGLAWIAGVNGSTEYTPYTR